MLSHGKNPNNSHNSFVNNKLKLYRLVCTELNFTAWTTNTLNLQLNWRQSESALNITAV